jgi:hypothetical protein
MSLGHRVASREIGLLVCLPIFDNRSRKPEVAAESGQTARSC